MKIIITALALLAIAAAAGEPPTPQQKLAASLAQATKEFPDLQKAGTELHFLFRARYNSTAKEYLLAHPDFPLQAARKIAAEIAAEAKTGTQPSPTPASPTHPVAVVAPEDINRHWIAYQEQRAQAAQASELRKSRHDLDSARFESDQLQSELSAQQREIAREMQAQRREMEAQRREIKSQRYEMEKQRVLNRHNY